MDNYYKAQAINLFAYLGLMSVSLAYIIIIEQNLWNITIYSTNNVTTIFGQCLLQTDYTSGYDVCYYAYSLPAFTLLTAFMVSLFTSCMSMLSAAYANLTFAVITLGWWIIGASVMTSYIVDANNAGVPEEYWRNVILGLGWGEVALCFLLLAVVTH